RRSSTAFAQVGRRPAAPHPRTAARCVRESRTAVRPGPDGGRAAGGEAVSERRPTMNPIILATDGSPSAVDATQQAVELARSTGGNTFVVAEWDGGPGRR